MIGISPPTQPHPLTRATDVSEISAVLNEIRNLEKLINVQIEQIRSSATDREVRIRVLEVSATKFNFILYMSMGGGLMSLIELIAILAILANLK